MCLWWPFALPWLPLEAAELPKGQAKGQAVSVSVPLHLHRFQHGQEVGQMWAVNGNILTPQPSVGTWTASLSLHWMCWWRIIMMYVVWRIQVHPLPFQLLRGMRKSSVWTPFSIFIVLTNRHSGAILTKPGIASAGKTNKESYRRVKSVCSCAWME